MADFVTEKAFYQCAAGILFKCSENKNSSVKCNGSLVMTTGGKLQAMAPVCPLLTARNQGAPTPCTTRFSDWILTSPLHVMDGQNALTSDSLVVCNEFGTPVKLRLNPDGFIFSKGGSVSSIDLAVPAISTIAQEQKKEADKNGQTGQKTEASSQSSQTSGQTSSQANAKQEGGKSTAAPSAESGKTKDDEPKAAYRCKECNKKDCKERREGDIDWDGLSAEVHNESLVLRKNYMKYLDPIRDNESAQNSADSSYLASLKACDEITDGGKPWTYAAHHLVSGNQVFKKYEKLVKIANACGYDINCRENCIMLVSNMDEFGKKPDDLKSIAAYDVMSIAAMQWHVGGHEYHFSEEIRKIIEKNMARQGLAGKPVKNYMLCVKDEVRRIQYTLDEKSICPASVKLKMNNCSDKIRKKLAAFREKPSSSYPFFVSRETYRFAFDFPENNKLAVMRGQGDTILVERFNVKKYKNENTLVFKPINTDGSYTMQFDQADMSMETRKKLIIFLQNISLFIFLDLKQKPDLRFDILLSSSTESNGLPTEQFLYQKMSEIRVWLRVLENRHYVAPCAMIRSRLKQLERGNA